MSQSIVDTGGNRLMGWGLTDREYADRLWDVLAALGFVDSRDGAEYSRVLLGRCSQAHEHSWVELRTGAGNLIRTYCRNCGAEATSGRVAEFASAARKLISETR